MYEFGGSLPLNTSCLLLAINYIVFGSVLQIGTVSVSLTTLHYFMSSLFCHVFCLKIHTIHICILFSAVFVTWLVKTKVV